MDSVDYRSQTELQQKFIQNDPGLPEDLSLAFHSYHLLEGLPSFVDDRAETINAVSKSMAGYNSRNAALAYANYHWMYQDFPRNFRQVLDAFNNKPSTSKSDQRQKFEKVFSGQWFPEIWSAYKRYWVDRVDQGMAHKSVALFQEEQDMLDSRKYITQGEAMREFGFNTIDMSKLIKGNKINYRKVPRGKTYDLAIERTSLEEIVKVQSLFIDHVAVQSLLGVARDQVKKLTAAGLLKRKGSPTNKWLYDIRDVEEFLDQCRGAVITEELVGGRYQEVVKRYMVEGFTLVDLLSLIKQKKLDAYTNKPNGTLQDSVVDEVQLNRYIETVRERRWQQQGYTLNEVSKLLRVGYCTLLKMK